MTEYGLQSCAVSEGFAVLEDILHGASVQAVRHSLLSGALSSVIQLWALKHCLAAAHKLSERWHTFCCSCRSGIIECPTTADVLMLKRLFQYQAHNKLLPALQVSTHGCRSSTCGRFAARAGCSTLCTLALVP